MAFDNIRRKLGMSQEEIEGLSQPSVMDEYIKQNDPEQYEKIEQAKRAKDAVDLGASSALGTIGKVNPEMSQLENYLKLRRETDPNFGKMDEIIKAIPTKDPNFQRLSPEEIAKFKGYANEPLDKEKFFDKLKLLINK